MAGEVVEAERVGRAHRGDDAGDAPPVAHDVAQARREHVHPHLVVVGRRDANDVVFAQTEPVADREAGVVRAVGAHEHGGRAQPGAPGAGHGLLEANLRAVEQRAGAAEREHPVGSRRVVAHERGRHRDGLDLGERHVARRLFADEVRVVDRRQQPADDARDRRRRDDVDLGAGMAPDEHPREVADQFGGDGSRACWGRARHAALARRRSRASRANRAWGRPTSGRPPGRAPAGTRTRSTRRGRGRRRARGRPCAAARRSSW